MHPVMYLFGKAMNHIVFVFCFQHATSASQRVSSSWSQSRWLRSSNFSFDESTVVGDVDNTGGVESDAIMLNSFASNAKAQSKKFQNVYLFGNKALYCGYVNDICLL